jgi:single-strand DNA-binding protein
MASLNKVLLIGNLTRDPEIRYIPSGTAVGDLRLAVNRRFRTADGQDHDETCFVNVTVWGRAAETCGEYLRKGSPLLVEGRLKYDEWEKEGQKHSRISVVAERTQFLGAPRGELQDGPAGQATERPPATPAPAPRNFEPASAAPEPAAAASDTATHELEADEENLPF